VYACPPKHASHFPEHSSCLQAVWPLCGQSSQFKVPLFLPPLKGVKLPLLSVPLVSSCSLLLPIKIRSPLPDQPRQHLLWEAFQSPPTESSCLPVHSLAFTFLRACYKASHSTKDIFLSCESDCSSPLQKTCYSPSSQEGLHSPSPPKACLTLYPHHTRAKPRTSSA